MRYSDVPTIREMLYQQFNARICLVDIYYISRLYIDPVMPRYYMVSALSEAFGHIIICRVGRDDPI